MKRYITARGFSLVELIVTISIIAVLVLVAIFSFSKANGREVLKKDVQMAMAVLDQARSQTLSYKNSSVYGVHFEDNRVVLFPGTTYSSANSANVITDIDALLKVDDISLAGSGNEVVFDHLTGATDNYGTVTIVLRSDSSVTETINISATGVVELQ